MFQESLHLKSRKAREPETLKLTKMAYFLRYTDSATEDLERGTSVNASDLNVDEISKEDAAAMFSCDESMINEVNGYWYQVLDGICGYELESDSLEDAIDEVKEGNRQFSFVGKPVIFKGVMSRDAEFVADGDLFYPSSIEVEL